MILNDFDPKRFENKHVKIGSPTHSTVVMRDDTIERHTEKR
jgi:hypothetical protein